MPKYTASMPIVGTVTFKVEADDEEGAKEAFWAVLNSSDELPQDAEVEWDYTDPISEGNVLHAPQNSFDATLVEDE